MNNGFGWDRLPKSFMAESTVFLLLTALIRNFYKAIIHSLDVKRFGLKATSRIKAFVFRFISVPAKWIRTSRRYVLILPQVALWGKGILRVAVGFSASIYLIIQ